MALGSNLNKKASPENMEEDQAAVMEKEENLPSNEKKEENDSTVQYCVFKAGTEFYGIPIELVKEVVVSPVKSPIPQMPHYITGMVNVRGNIYGVLDLKSFFQNEHGDDEDMNYLLLLEHDEYQMGIMIPRVPDTLSVSQSEIENLPTSRLKSVLGQKYLKGILKKNNQMIILFDILGMISGKKFAEVM